MATYVLPDLGYAYDALEPTVSATIMQLHHDKHHRAYVVGANDTLAKLEEARENDDLSRVAALEHALAFNVSGHLLHSIFWRNLSPTGGGKPVGELAQQLDSDFGGFDKMRAQLLQATSTIMGSGWGALAWDPIGQRLVTAQIHDHQSEVTQAGIPLLVIDAWEHAYYLQYRNEKKKFFQAIWDLFDWRDVEARLKAARKVDLALPELVSPTP